MAIYLFSRKALVRALAAGRQVWCAETGEGWQLEGGCSLNRARHTAGVILRYWEGKTFFIQSGKS